MTVKYGLALQNFTPGATSPDIEDVVRYAVTAEEAGFDSLWAWDHLFLGARRPFPFLESLTTLTTIARHTRDITLGTGVLVLPLRDPVVLAKTTATMQAASGGRIVLGVATGWYEREFEAVGVPFGSRGRVFEENLEVLYALWKQDGFSGEFEDRKFKQVRMLPLPSPRPGVLIGGYADRVLRRVATRSDGWLTYFYTPESFERSWAKVRIFAEDSGRDPGELQSVAQLPLCIDSSYELASKRSDAFVADYFDMAEWSESTVESAIRGTPEQCAEQIQAHIDAGVGHVVLCPYEYHLDQIERFAHEVLPLLPRAVEVDTS